MKKLYVFRGLPGSGKSTLANKLAALVVEPDMFRYDADRKYVFDSSKNDEVYQKTDWLLGYAMSVLDVQCVAVAATNVKLEPVRRYVEAGKGLGYDVTVVECRGDYGNVHDVPQAVVAKMAREFEPLTPELAEEWGVRLEIAGSDQARAQTPSRRWAVTYVDYGETCDGKARIHGIYESRAKAVAELEKDMERYAGENPMATLDMVDWSADLGDNAGCEWNVEGLPA